MGKWNDSKEALVSTPGSVANISFTVEDIPSESVGAVTLSSLVSTDSEFATPMSSVKSDMFVTPESSLSDFEEDFDDFGCFAHKVHPTAGS